MLNQLFTVKDWLEGKKTYLVSALMILSALGSVADNALAVLNGSMTWSVFMDSGSLWVLLNGLGLGSLRAGIAKVL